MIDDIKISKFISLVLRYKPEVIGTKLDKNGYILTNDLIEGVKNKFNIDFNLSDLKRIVKNDNKQRYSFNDDMEYIRANQGHSIKVNLGLEPIKPSYVLYHGTCKRVVNSILAKGIKPMNRQYVHLSKDIETASKVGRRHGDLIIFKVNSNQMYLDGYNFYLSENDVWLTDYVPVKYLSILNENSYE